MPLARAVTRFLGFGKRDERGYFDSAFYLATYPDIAQAGADPYQHFMNHGWREGRDPSASFRTLYYRDFHLDGAETNPLTHYIESGGAASGLPTIPASEADFTTLQRGLTADHFDTAFYRPQASAGTLDLLGDYLTNGWRQGRGPSPDFDVTRYSAEFQFVKALGVSPLYHFASQERMKARHHIKAPRKAPAVTVPRKLVETVVAPEFDGDYYLRNNADVREAELDPLRHYIDHGWREGRNPSPLFDGRFYATANDDVALGGVTPFYHYLTVGRGEGRRGNRIGTHLYPPMTAPSDAEWTAVPPAADTMAATVVVIIPVYKGYGESLRAIHAVLAAAQVTSFALHVVNDVTPDEALDAKLAELAGRGLFSYSRNETNLGFVKTCNRALRLFADKEVILLNADAKVSGDWLDRMVAHAARDPDIATITPLSNNATICSYPVLNGNNLVEPGMDAAALDRLAAICNAGRLSEVPTGVGFCFCMSRASRDAIGLLDEEAFRRGYGEENDFCLRAAKAGFRNVLAEDIFVYHAGEVSFASFVAAEYGPAQKALLGKHPDYQTRIRWHLEADPGRVGRMRLDLYRLAKATGRDSIVFVSHALDGGIPTHLAHLETRLRETGTNVVYIRVGVGTRWGVEIASGKTGPYCPNLTPTAFNQMAPLLEEFLGWLKPRAVHVHSLVGFDWSATTALMDLLRETAIPYFFTLHDYSVVCHRNDLVLTNGRYCGLPDVGVCRTCVAADRSYPEGVDPAVRRATFDAFLRGAKGVFAPSDDIKMRLEAAGVGYEIGVRPHEESAAPIAARRTVEARPRDDKAIDIVTIGAIGEHKGASIILDLARDAKARSLPLRFHIVGYSSETEAMLAQGVEETGRYANESEAIDLIDAIRPAMVLLPSIWPETFCYVLSMAFRLRIPPVVFDIGAPAARIEKAGFGFVLPYSLTDDIRGLNDRLCALPASSAHWDDTKAEVGPLYRDVLTDYYGIDNRGSR